VVLTATTEDPQRALEEVLERAGLWSALERAQAQHGASLRVLIKPDLDHVDAAATTGTDPKLVEQLIDLLAAHGHEDVRVAGAPGEWTGVLANRDVLSVADLVGYHFVTPAGRPYEIIDLAADGAGDADSSVGGDPTGRWHIPAAWREAEFRILFAKNKTHAAQRFSLGLHQLLELVAGQEDAAGPSTELAEILPRRSPPEFAIIDAWQSSHGVNGSGVPCPIPTRTFIAGEDLLATDAVAAMKMGLDPFASPLLAAALRANGGLGGLAIDGDLAPYPGWINVHPLVAEIPALAGQPAPATRLLTAASAAPDTSIFPLEDARLEPFRRVVAGLAARAGDNPLSFWALAWLRAAAAWSDGATVAWRVLADKPSLVQRDVPLGFDPADFTTADYDAVIDYMQPIEAILEGTEPDAGGLQWRYFDGSVIFRYARLIPAPFADFTAQVRVAEAVQLMNDYLGGASVAIARDDQGRVTHQATRTIYLPQPNYMVLYGGRPIDVSKLERALYEPGRHKVLWRTVRSINDSAELDDGAVTFFDRGAAGTEVVVVARQKFRLPVFWEAVELDRMPEIKDYLVGQAYRVYFEQTIANFEACYEGRPVRIGHGAGDAGTQASPALEQWARMARRAGDAMASGSRQLGRLVNQAVAVEKPAPVRTDDQGFQHFTAASVRPAARNGQPAARPPAPAWARWLGDFATGFGAAARGDLDLPPRRGAKR
jgi:uncharacterized protein (DUF362 family)